PASSPTPHPVHCHPSRRRSLAPRAVACWPDSCVPPDLPDSPRFPVMKNASRLLLAAVFALLLGACAASPNRSAHSANMGKLLPPPDTTSASGAYQGATDYRVGAQDLLEISVFGVDELKHQARVNS